MAVNEYEDAMLLRFASIQYLGKDRESVPTPQQYSTRKGCPPLKKIQGNHCLDAPSCCVNRIKLVV